MGQLRGCSPVPWTRSGWGHITAPGPGAQGGGTARASPETMCHARQGTRATQVFARVHSPLKPGGTGRLTRYYRVWGNEGAARRGTAPAPHKTATRALVRGRHVIRAPAAPATGQPHHARRSLAARTGHLSPDVPAPGTWSPCAFSDTDNSPPQGLAAGRHADTPQEDSLGPAALETVQANVDRGQSQECQALEK